jgi:hypothetical protein
MSDGSGATPTNAIGLTLQPSLRGPGGRLPTPKIHPFSPPTQVANPNTVINRQRPSPDGPTHILNNNNVGGETNVWKLFD